MTPSTKRLAGWLAVGLLAAALSTEVSRGLCPPPTEEQVATLLLQNRWYRAENIDLRCRLLRHAELYGREVPGDGGLDRIPPQNLPTKPIGD